VKVSAFRSGPTGPSISVSGSMEKLAVLEDSSWQTATPMKENGSKIKHMASGSICMQMVLATRANGLKTSKMGRDMKDGLMEVSIKGRTKMVRSKAKGNLRGKMGLRTMVIGCRIKCMGMVCSNGLMVDAIRASIKMTESMAMEFLGIRMVDKNRVYGKMENKYAL
jgi:hypothetical protein